MVHHPLVEAGTGHVQASVVDQRLEELGVVDHLVVPAELGILVGQGVEAVGALGDDLLNPHLIEGLNVLHGQHLEDVLIARATSRVAGAVLSRTQDGEADPGPLEQLGHRLGDLAVLVVK